MDVKLYKEIKVLKYFQNITLILFILKKLGPVYEL